jgi:hypothetical protein
VILLIPASWVARITGVSHQHPAIFPFWHLKTWAIYSETGRINWAVQLLKNIDETRPINTGPQSNLHLLDIFTNYASKQN